MFSRSLLAIFILIGASSNFLPYDAVGEVNMKLGLSSPGAANILGTDHLGRDIALRLIIGMKAFFFPSIIACLTCLIFGLSLGSSAGYLGGIYNKALNSSKLFLSGLPLLPILLLSLSIYGNDMKLLGFIVGLHMTPGLAALIHRRVSEFALEDFIIASESHGISRGRILFYHILYLNMRGEILVYLVQVIGVTILVETSLSYLGGGFGVNEPEPSWGNMLAQAKDYIFSDEAWYPAIIIFVLVATLSFLYSLSEGEKSS